MRDTSFGRSPAPFPCENLENRRLFAYGGLYRAALAAAMESGVFVPQMHAGHGPGGGFGGFGFGHNYGDGGYNAGTNDAQGTTGTATAGSSDTAAAQTGEMTITLTVNTNAARGSDSAALRVPVSATANGESNIPVKTDAAVAAAPAVPASAVAAILDTAAPTPAAAASATPDATFTVTLPAADVKPSWTAAGLAGQTAPTSGSGLVNLLDRHARTADVAAAGKTAGVVARTTAAKAADPADATLEVAPTSVKAAEASFLPAPSEAAGHRPLWQTVAVATAGAVLVSANWVVRRRNRKTALAVRRGTL